jgi:RNA polymerase sigma factor (sigma-70 family)
LVAAVRAGDDRAFEQLYGRYRRRIAAYIYGMVKDYGRAEEIAQDVFVSALRRMRNTDSDIAFKPWIYEIAKNACIDQFRRGRRAELVSYDADEGLGETDRGRLATTSPSPDAAVDQKLSIDHLRGAFGGLSEAHHDILVMRELEGMSYREIGERLGMSRASVESTLFRARKRLSEEYEELVSGERCLRVQAIISASAGGALGARDQRRMARHVSYCQPCRRHAALAGLDIAALTAKPPVRAKIAALLPLPAFLRRRWELNGDGRDAAAPSPQLQSFAQWSAQVAPSMDPAGMANWAKAAVAAATVAIAGVSANVAHEKLGGSSPAPDAAKPAVTRQAQQPASGTAAVAATQAVDPRGAAVGGEAATEAPAGADGIAGGTGADPGQLTPRDAPQSRDPSHTPGHTDFGRPPANEVTTALPPPAPPPAPGLGESTKDLLTPPASLLQGSRTDGERRQDSDRPRGPVGQAIESTESGLMGAMGLPASGSAPAGSQPTGAEQPASSGSAPSPLGGLLSGDGASARTQGGGSGSSATMTDTVREVVGSLVAR